jgi:hypothetical protein
MKKSIDFSAGIRGKFHRPGALAMPPVYLDKRSMQFVADIAKKNKTDISTVVNKLILADIELVRTAV